MARRASLLLILLLLVAVTVAAAVHASAVGGGEDVGTRRRWLQDVGNSTATATNGTTSYISYGALSADTVPCSVQGASYYNCRPGGAANPYQRGCSAITQCRD